MLNNRLAFVVVGVIIVTVAVGLTACGGGDRASSLEEAAALRPTHTPTTAPTASLSLSPTPTPPPTATPTQTPEPTPSPTPAPTATPTQTPEPALSPTPAPTATPALAPTATPAPESQPAAYAKPVPEDGWVKLEDNSIEGSEILVAKDQLIVVAVPGTTKAEIVEALQEIDAAIVGEIPSVEIYQVELPSGLAVEEAIDRLERNPAIEAASLNFQAQQQQSRLRRRVTPNDPGFERQDYLRETRVDEAWAVLEGYVSALKGDEGWTISDLTSEVAIAIVEDSGIQGLDDDPELRVTARFDVTTGTAATIPNGYHGTCVASVAAAIPDNGIGVAGVAWNASLIEVIIGKDTYSMLAGIEQAVSMGAKVINVSTAGWATESVAGQLARIVRRANEAGVLIVAATANEHKLHKDLGWLIGHEQLPAAYAADHNNVISVAGIEDGRLAMGYYSPITLGAPPTVLDCESSDSQYRNTIQGTSFVAPQVSGLAALIWTMDYEANGEFTLTPGKVRQIMEETANNPYGYLHLGAGSIDAAAALERTAELLGVDIAPEPTPTPTPQPTPAPTPSPPPSGAAADRAALVTLYNATGGPNWSRNDNWLTGAPIGEWEGVGTNSNGRVNSLWLAGNRLNGELPPELGNISGLLILNLPRNSLTGKIPSALEDLSDLQILSLHQNRLSGQIPAELGNLPRLETLRLNDNRLSGQIPPELGSLANLEDLNLSGNRLSGEIPPELGNLANLEDMYLSGNRLTGCIPEGLRDVPENDFSELGLPFCGARPPDASESDRAALVALYNATDGPNWTTSTNWLTDRPLSEWHGVDTDDNGRVTGLDLAFNGLNGEIPPQLGSLANLSDLSLAANRLSGEIPPELGSLSSLVWLWLGGNQLSGEIPLELGRLTNLEGLVLGHNQLSGEIPPELGNLANLKRLRLGGNQLSGEIPLELGRLTNLEGLVLGHNQLSGQIPAELGNLSNLEELDLSGNRLSGEIPRELGSLPSLRVLSLMENQLTGCIHEGLKDVQINDLSELGLPFCGSQTGGELLLTVQEDPFAQGIFPGEGVSRVTRDVFSLVFSRLVRGDDGQELDLAEYWEASRDFREWIVGLRQDVRFHDGSGATAQDVTYSIRSLQEIQALLGSELRQELGLSWIAWIDEVFLIDDYTVSIRFQRPFPGFSEAMASPAFLIVPNGMWLDVFGSTTLDETVSAIVGSGPFRVVEYQPEVRLVLDRNPHYYGMALPDVDRLIIQVVPDRGLKHPGICAPAGSAFQTWFREIASVPGDGCSPAMPIDPPTPTPPAGASILLNGDFSEGLLGWDVETNLGCGDHSEANLLGSDERYSNVLQIRADGNGGCHTNTIVTHSLDITLSDGAGVFLTADVKSVHSSVRNSCGDTGGEMPAQIRLHYLTKQGAERLIWWTFTHKTGGTCGDRDGWVVSDKPAFGFNTTVPHNEWHSFTSANTNTIDPDMARITSLDIAGRGWDYESRIDNVRLMVSDAG